MSELCSNAPIAWHFVLSVSITTPINILGLFGNIFLLYVLIRNKFLPGNVRLILGNISCSMMAAMVVFGWRNIDAWRAVTTGYRPSVQSTCGIQSTSISLFLASVAFCLMCLGVERSVSTRDLLRQRKPSEKVSKSVILLITLVWGIALGAGIVVLRTEFSGETQERTVENHNTSGTFGIQNISQTEVDVINNETIIQLYNISEPNTTLSDEITLSDNAAQPLCWCTSKIVSKSSVVVPVVIFFDLWILLGISLYVLVLKISKRKLAEWNVNSDRHDLNIRFHLKQNVIITDAVLPASIALAVLLQIYSAMLIGTSLIFPEHWDPQKNLSTASSISVLLNVPNQIFAVVYVMAIYMQMPGPTVTGWFIKKVTPLQNKVNTTQKSVHPSVTIKVQGAAVEQEVMDLHQMTGRRRTSRDVRNYQLSSLENMKVLEAIWAKGKV